MFAQSYNGVCGCGIKYQFIDMIEKGMGKGDLSGIARDIQDAVDKAVEHREWEAEYMTLYLKFQEERDEGRAEGRAEVIRNMIKSGMPIDQIAKICNYELSDVKKIQDEMCASK